MPTYVGVREQLLMATMSSHSGVVNPRFLHALDMWPHNLSEKSNRRGEMAELELDALRARLQAANVLMRYDYAW